MRLIILHTLEDHFNQKFNKKLQKDILRLSSELTYTSIMHTYNVFSIYNIKIFFQSKEKLYFGMKIIFVKRIETAIDELLHMLQNCQK